MVCKSQAEHGKLVHTFQGYLILYDYLIRLFSVIDEPSVNHGRNGRCGYTVALYQILYEYSNEKCIHRILKGTHLKTVPLL